MPVVVRTMGGTIPPANIGCLNYAGARRGIALHTAVGIELGIATTT